MSTFRNTLVNSTSSLRKETDAQDASPPAPSPAERVALVFPLLALGGASALSVALFFGRFLLTGTPTYGFLLWNLLLAWMPVVMAWMAGRWRHYGPLLLLHSALWLLFLPNAPYLLTDLIHLGRGGGFSLWYDLLMLLTFALTGLFLGFFSLSLMQDLVTAWLGAAAGWLFAATVLALSSFGVYLGRFLRWNSWDLLTNPQWLLRDVLALVRNPLLHWQPWAFILLLTLMLGLAYVALAGRPARAGH